ncbi:GGDEF domain-containing protein [Chelativorans sp. M5D2P16]|uniref:GGDEF domain-containing protein n=1 Tax=Chelativorans sp. M5D2P16 TaxID=3095678 RepID=UPI002ACA3F8E|nr:GGDEF domain-containing protein [Chelativorans sp. M5D2P16]MDZ5700055.1 GGDEF domain-containing protein [Chelativorans sp. M5D2P16]
MSLATGFCLLAFAMLSQVAEIPANVGHNSLTAGLLYTVGMLLVSNGILERSDRRFPSWLAALYLVGIVGGLWYFYYVYPNLIGRIYVLNFGLGLILLNACFLARFLAVGTRTDRALFWLLAGFGGHFLPRTLLTINSVAPGTTPGEFEQSVFWKTILLTTPILGAFAGLSILGVLVVDIVTKLRHERDLDPLTGVLNRRGLERRVGRLWGMGHAGQSGVVAVCDIDKFKAVNDMFGHGFGDTVLKRFAAVIRDNTRRHDIVARFGGEEFVLILKDMEEDQAFALTERVRTAIENTSFGASVGRKSITCSFGLARIRPGEPFGITLSRADKALYAAKSAGRNRTLAEWLPDMIEILTMQERKAS